MGQNMDSSVHPCWNFYQFACGKFARSPEVDEHASANEYSSMIVKKIQRQLRTLIDNDVKDNGPKPFRMLRKYYNVCMNEGEKSDLS